MDKPGMRLQDAMVLNLSQHCNPDEDLLPVEVGREAHDPKGNLLLVEMGIFMLVRRFFRSRTRERRARSRQKKHGGPRRLRLAQCYTERSVVARGASGETR
jgi:hypothetical protein